MALETFNVGDDTPATLLSAADVILYVKNVSGTKSWETITFTNFLSNVATGLAATFDASGAAAAAQAAAIAASAQRASNLSDLASAATARTNLGIAGGSSSPVSGWSGVVAYNRANDLSTGAITTIAQAYGTADAFTGTGTITTGGANSKKYLLLNGTSDAWATTTGGASLTGDWYMACVVAPTATNRVPMSWGTHAANQWRAMLFGGDDFIYFWANAGNVKADVQYETDGTTVYFIEIESVSGTVSVYVNGLLCKTGTPTQSAYASTVLRLGQQPQANDFFAGRLYEWAFATARTTAEKQAYRRYVSSFYALGTGGGKALAGFDSSDAVGPVQLWEQGGSLNYGGFGTLQYSTTADPTAGEAKHTFWGTCVFYAPGGVHALRSSVAGQNVVSIRNENPSGLGFSAAVFEDSDGHEHGAIGYAPPGSGTWGGTNGAVYIEAANFSTPTVYGEFRLVQTKDSGATTKLRMELDRTDRLLRFYDENGVAVATVTADGQLLIPYVASDPASPTNGSIWINSSSGKMKARIGGVTVELH